MDVPDRTKNYIDGIRCPAIKGLTPEHVAIPHMSMVEIVHLRRSIERTRFRVDQSWRAAYETAELLKRLHLEGF